MIPFFPKKFIWLFSRKYIAGEKLGDAFRVIKELNKQHILSTIDILGESVTSREQALEYQKCYIETIALIAKAQINSTFSLKPTMFGLLWDEDFCYRCIRDIVKTAHQYRYFVRIDMEDSNCTSKEILLYEQLHREFHDNVGIVFQSCLKRTYSDLQYIKSITTNEFPPNIRLCKGIYRETPEIAFQKKHEIRDSFIQCLEYILANNMYAAIATHDKILIQKSIHLQQQYNRTTNDFEFQMLLGVTPRLRSKLVNEGYPMRVYVPYGEQWFQYSARRLQENPHMVRDIIMGMFIRK